MARKKRPFFPINMPRFWIVFAAACLLGMGVGLVGLAAAWFKLQWLAQPMMVVFVCCWGVAAISGVCYAVRFLAGRYRNLASRPWSEQIW